MNSGSLRTTWPAFAALLVLAAFWLAHSLGFQPLAVRYRRQLSDAGAIGASLDPSLQSAPLPPRVIDVMHRNSVDAAEGRRLMASGLLATELVRRISATAVECGIDVSASEPGAAAQTTGTLEVRARLRLHCRYDQLVELLDDLKSERMLYRIEQLTVSPMQGGRVNVDLEVAQALVLQQAGTP